MGLLGTSLFTVSPFLTDSYNDYGQCSEGTGISPSSSSINYIECEHNSSLNQCIEIQIDRAGL